MKIFPSGRLPLVGSLALLAGLLVAFPAEPQSSSTFVRGDVNQDGGVSFADLIPLINNTILTETDSPPLGCRDAADVNDDGRVDISDVFSMFVFLLDPNVTTGFPAPYPGAGVDPTLDLLPPCITIPDPDPSGSDIPHIYFSYGIQGAPGLAAYPGQTDVHLPVFLDTSAEIEGYTISVRYNPTLITRAEFVFGGSVALEHSADLHISESPPEFPDISYAYVVLEISPPFTSTSIPGGTELLLGNLVVDVAPELVVGGRALFTFADTPPSGAESPVRNEIVQMGGDSLQPVRHDMELVIAPRDAIFVRGDVLADGLVNLVDAIAIIDYLFGLDAPPLDCVDAADINDDGSVNIVDAICLLSFQFGFGEAPPAPFPYLGVDTTEDSIPGCDGGG